MTNLGKKVKTSKGLGTVTHETDYVWTIILDNGKVIKMMKDLDTLLGVNHHGNGSGTYK